MVKVLIFDMGGVLIRTMSHASRHEWENRLGLAQGESEQIVFNSEMGQAAQRGEIGDAELWQWVGERLALDEAELNAFRDGFWAGDKINEPLVAHIRALREAGWRTAVLSNFTDILNHLLTETYPIADAFEMIIGSAYEKVMKPDPRIYHIALQKLGIEAHEAVFVDDFAHNIDGAKAVGLHGIHFTPNTDVPAELSKLGVQLKRSKLD